MNQSGCIKKIQKLEGRVFLASTALTDSETHEERGKGEGRVEVKRAQIKQNVVSGDAWRKAHYDY